MRICGNYVPLNAHLVGNSYPLPNIQDTLQRAAQGRYFAKIDLTKSFWQIPLAPESRPLTAFYGVRGLYEYTRVPFGLKVAPAIFQSTTDRVIKEFSTWAIPYVDDVAVIGATYEECKERITKLCEKLEAKKFTINYDKSVVEPQTQLEFLGHLICSGHVTIHPHHAETICKLPIPETSAELHSFLGFGNCFRRFIPRYAELVAPLYKVLKREPYHLAAAEKESGYKRLSPRYHHYILSIATHH
ncbi:putative retroelement protein [Gregarina niphandrodes]|uniref:Retroelement protein n=1 Tax=Gregarina niphandrodes TaxID=110365 RepID=A0A023AVC0_GRENI|nr:putative retroelement protein [Gregarina niphandrodes]EZG42691.1 putative retroelement protein [Gregarina niphandrodes]|eukprot:XP_011134749.1 putative retroelement protein [Gregarina niphandrodes]